MSISEIIAFRKLFPDQEPELSFFRPDEPPKLPYRFTSQSDELSARSEATALIEQLFEKHDEDEKAATDEFRRLIETDERLQAAVIHEVFDKLVSDSPALKRHFAKLERAKRKRGTN